MMCRNHRVKLVGVLLASALAVAVLPGSARAAAPSSQAFGFDNTTQHFTVPAGVHTLHLTAWGGSGGSGGARSGDYAAPGGLGAHIDLDAPVNPGDTLVIEVGGAGGSASGQSAGSGANSSGSGENGGPGGNVNSGVDGTAGGGGGGGTTVIDTASTTFLVAGGGGGGGGGGATVAGYNGGQGGDGGTTNDYACDPTFGPGVYGSGLTGGAGGQCARPQNGPAGISGAGERPSSGAGTGGGGGGGLIGGDGGASGGSSGGGGGGGGAGSSFWSSVTSGVMVTNGGPGNGGVVISWTPNPPAGIQHSQSFSGCCALHDFTVPAGVTQLTVTGWGGSGGAGGGNAEGVIAPRGGFGAVIREIVPVDPGDKLTIETGGAGGNGDYAPGNARSVPISGGAGGGSQIGEGGGKGGSITVPDGNYYGGGTGGGGGGATYVLDATSAKLLLNAGGGGGGGGDDAASFGDNGGIGGNAGSPLVSGQAVDGNGYFGSGGSTPGYSNGAGGVFASSGSGNGQPAADSTQGNLRGTGGGGGAGVRGGTAGGQCSGFSCANSGGGGAAGSSAWADRAQDVMFANSLGGAGGVTISWVAPVDTTTALRASADHLVAGTPVTLTATISAPDAPSGTAPSGTVIFVDFDTGFALAPPVPLSPTSPYQATLTTTLPTGTDHVYAAYTGGSGFGPSTSAQLVEHVAAKLSLDTASLPAAEVGTPYTAQLAARGGAAPYTWSVSDGALPAGLTLHPDTGAITGTPTEAGSHHFSVSVADAGSPAQAVAQALTLVVNAAPTPLPANPMPTPTPTPAPQPPAIQHLPAVTTLVRGPTVVHRDTVRFTLRCAHASCHVRATLRARGATVAHAAIALRAGTTRTVTLKLDQRGRRLLARSHRLPVRLAIVQRSAGGRLRTVGSARLVLRRGRGG